ncbi:MAG: DUF4339 domain-containing protein [Planctomycetes bacterium]|nr:DUF4339 domain-containing protein [Planctomycetota bacterium]
MATQWYWREGETELGPISFPELTEMIRQHTLNEDDLVRPHYSKTWQTTDTVVGLYYMANRTPIPRAVVAEDDPAGVTHPDDVTPAGRAYRLDDVTHNTPSSHGATPSATAESDFGEILAAAPVLDGDEGVEIGSVANFTHDDSDGVLGNRTATGEWDSVLQAAVEHVDARSDAADVRSKGNWLDRIARLYQLAGNSGVMQQGFRLSVAAGCAWGFSMWVTNWSNQQALRFPPRNPQEQQLRFFPVIGACYTEDYWMLLAMSAVLLGMAAYLMAAKMERRFLEIE